MININTLLKRAKRQIKGLNEGRILQAYDFAAERHEGKTRLTGEPYINHILEVADILLNLKPDEDSLVACLLHDVFLERERDKEILLLEKEFGKEVANLVQGLVRLKVVKANSEEEEQVENLRKLFLAMAKDIRVVFIRLADRLHNIRTISVLAEDKIKKKARETLDVYTPLAGRLGIYSIKSEMEDLCFKYLYPQLFAELQKELNSYIKQRETSIQEIQRLILNILQQEGIQAEVQGRIKHLYSIYIKLKRKNKNSVKEIHDVFAIRIILPDIMKDDRESLEHCYRTLGVIHRYFTPLPGRFKDYIALPKVNGYRSLHTTVIGFGEIKSGQPVEIQLRTEGMNQQAEYGLASHWSYKDSKVGTNYFQQEMKKIMDEEKSVERVREILKKDLVLKQKVKEMILAKKENEWDDSLLHFFSLAGISVQDLKNYYFYKLKKEEKSRGNDLLNQVHWIRQLTNLQNDIKNDSEFMRNLKVDIFEDRIFVLTPTGEVKDLPVGSTPVDFAYAVHTEIGHACQMAKVNGEIVSLAHELKNGDVVEILVKNKPRPNRYWLSFIKTNFARQKIIGWFNEQDREKIYKEGKNALNSALRRIGKPVLDPDLTLLKKIGQRELSLKEREYILESVGNGAFTPMTVLKKIFSPEEIFGLRKKSIRRGEKKKGEITKEVKQELTEKILIQGESGLFVRLPVCCKPKEGDLIVGYVTRGKGITIHRRDCSVLRGTEEDRLLEASWVKQLKDHQHQRYQAAISITYIDRRNILREIIDILSGMRIEMDNFSARRSNEFNEKRLNMVLKVSGGEDLFRIFTKLKGIKGVLEVSKA